MIKTMFVGCVFGRNKIFDSHNSTDSKGSIDYIGSIGSIESEDSTDSIDSIDSILVPHKRLPAFTPHTKSRADSTNGGKPPLVVSFSLCVV